MNRRQFLAATAATGAALALEPNALARRLGGTPVALVTADLEAHIAVVALSAEATTRAGAVVRRIKTREGPKSIESSHQAIAVVAHPEEGLVTLIDGPSLRVRRVLRGFSEPRYTACHRDGRHAYVTDSGNGELAVIDLERARVVRRLELGGPARHVSIDPQGRRIWASLGSKAAEIAVVDVRRPQRPRLRHRIRPPFLAHDVAFSPLGTRVWVSSGDVRRLAVYDAKARKLAFMLAGDAPPQHIWFNRRHVFITSGDDGILRTHNVRYGKTVRTARIPYGSWNVSGDGFRPFSPSLAQGTLTLLGRNGKPRWRRTVAQAAHDACYVFTA